MLMIFRKTGFFCINILLILLFLNNNLKASEIINCNHNIIFYHLAYDAEGGSDGAIGYYYCSNCGKYSADREFNTILSPEEVVDYYVVDEVVVELGGDSLKYSDVMITPIGFESAGFDGIDFSKYKYISSHSATGKLIKTTTNTKLYKNTLKPITIKVVTKCADPDKKVKTVRVKFELPEPKVKVKKKWNGDRCTYTFKYNIKGASKVKVRMVNGKNDKTINNTVANKIFDKYMSKAKSDKESYIRISKSFLNKYDNNIYFKVTAYYGKKKVSTTVKP